MAKKGLLVNYEFCTGCHSCEVACKQEHDYPVGKGGIDLKEIITKGDERLRIDYIPFLTEFCDLCAERTTKGDTPSCVKHCQAQCMVYGDLSELAAAAEDMPRSVIFAPRASYKLPVKI